MARYIRQVLSLETPRDDRWPSNLGASNRGDIFENLGANTKLASGFEEIAESHSVKVSVTKVCGMFSIFFTKSTPKNFLDVAASDTDKFNRFFHSMLKQGIYFGPSAYEAAFVSATHNEETTKKTLQAAENAFAELGQTKRK